MDEAERLELKVRRHHSQWVRVLCDLFAYSIAIGVPWFIGILVIIDAIRGHYNV